MAETVLSLVIHKLGELIIKEAALSGADEMIMCIEDEFESFIPEFEKIEALPQPPEKSDLDVEQIRQVIVRAQDLVNTYPKRVSQSKKLIYRNKLRSIVKELRRVQVEIADAKYQISVFVDRPPPSLHLQVEEEHLPEITGEDGTSNTADQTLPYYLRNCIYYFLLFPADFEIPARRLIVLWVAEGLIQPKKYDDESVEDIANGYLEELIVLDVVRVTKTKRNGNVRACQLKDAATRETWLNKAKEASFLPENTEEVRRLVDHISTGDESSLKIQGNLNISHEASKYRDLISFLSFDTQIGSKPGEDIGYFIHKCILAGCFERLKVLDLEGVFRPKLPKTLGNLLVLKYLGLRWTYIEVLPKFINELLNLELLDVKHTYISKLPVSIWSMRYLRHLYLNEAFRTKFPDRPSNVSLDNLQTLWGAFIDEDTCVEKGLDTMRRIRKLGLSCRSKQSDQDSKMPQQLEAIAKWISNLTFLESLRLKSRDERGRAAHLHLSSLENNRNLSTVYLLGKLNPDVVCEFPVSLTDITLSGSELDLDPMEFLRMLPNLQSLRLLALSVVLSKMRCSRRGFPQLKVFYIWKLENLEELEVERGSLPCLEDLEIRSCNQLKRLPDGLRYVNTLKKFRVTSMRRGFKGEAEKNQSQLLDDMERVLEFDPDQS